MCVTKMLMCAWWFIIFYGYLIKLFIYLSNAYLSDAFSNLHTKHFPCFFVWSFNCLREIQGLVYYNEKNSLFAYSASSSSSYSSSLSYSYSSSYSSSSELIRTLSGLKSTSLHYFLFSALLNSFFFCSFFLLQAKPAHLALSASSL